MKQKYPKPEVGQEVFIVPYDKRDKYETARIGKVGRKFFYLEDRRKVDIDRWTSADDRWKLFYVYPSKEVYLESELIKEYNGKICEFLETNKLDDLATINKVAKLIGLHLGE